MNINERLAEVRNALGSDADKVAHLLSDIEKETSTIARDLQNARSEISQVNRESAERRIKLREYEEILQDKDSTIEKLSNNEELQNYKSEVERLKQFESTVYSERKQKLTSELSTLSTHPDFEKFIQINPLPITDGKIEEDKLDVETVNKTRTELEKLKTLGLFAQPTKQHEANGQKFSSSKNTGEFYGFSSPEELLKKRPDLYREWRKDRGYA